MLAKLSTELPALTARLVGGSSQFRSNLTRLAVATLLAQLAGVLAVPVLSRLFSPTSFSVLTAFTFAHAFCMAFATARLDWIAPNAKTAIRLATLGTLGIFALIISAAAIFLAVSLEPVVTLMGYSAPVRFLLPISVFFGGLFLLLQSFAVYSGDLRHVSRAKLAQAVTATGAPIFLAVLGAGEFALVIGYVIGWACAVACLYPQLGALVSALLKSSLRRFSTSVHRYASRISASVAVSLVNVLSQSSILIMLLLLYDPITVGWFGLVYRLASSPIGIVTTSIAQSFWTEAVDLAKRRERDRLRRFYKGSILRLSLIALPFLAAFLLAPLYLPALLGPTEWSGAGYVLAALSPYLAAMIVFSPTTHLIVYDKASWQVAIDSATLVASLVVFAVVAASGVTAVLAIFASSVVHLLGYVIRFIAHLHAIAQLND